MLKQLQIGLRAFVLLASRVWTCLCFMIKKQSRAVSTNIYEIQDEGIAWHEFGKSRRLKRSRKTFALIQVYG